MWERTGMGGFEGRESFLDRLITGDVHRTPNAAYTTSRFRFVPCQRRS